MYPKSLEELIGICSRQDLNQRLRAASSHWSLSDAAVSDHTFIETHDPSNIHRALGRTLYDVIPGCMDQNILDAMGADHSPESRGSLIHIEAGKRIYQLYAELDTVDDLSDNRTMAGYINKWYNNPAYRGPWAFGTLGGAGGQSVVGALNTGTHGGDFKLPPLADSVIAVHLVADGGKQYWIESITEDYYPRLTDDNKLQSLYGTGSHEFEIIRDNDMFNAVLVSTGRFGIIYSVVLRVGPQYCLHERRRLALWQDIKDKIKLLERGPLFKEPEVTNCRFLQIVVCLTPLNNFRNNHVGVTKRWNVLSPLPANPAGRKERVGRMLEKFNDRIQAPLFEFAGASHSYN